MLEDIEDIKLDIRIWEHGIYSVLSEWVTVRRADFGAGLENRNKLVYLRSTIYGILATLSSGNRAEGFSCACLW